MLGNIGTTELLIILAIIMLLFGGSRIPQLGRGLGEGFRSFRDAFRGAPPPDERRDEPRSDDKTASGGSSRQ